MYKCEHPHHKLLEAPVIPIMAYCANDEWHYRCAFHATWWTDPKNEYLASLYRKIMIG